MSPGRYTDSVIGGFQYASDYLFNSSAVYAFAGAVSSTTLNGALANQMTRNPNSASYVTFNDPLDIILDAVRELSFRASLQAGKDNATITNAGQTVAYNGYVERAIYVTDYRYMSIAVAIGVLGSFAVGSTFWGWWRLGRDFSLNPLEVAKAFDAPLLKGAGSNIGFKDYPKAIKRRKIRYGAVNVTDQPYSQRESMKPLDGVCLLVESDRQVHSPKAGYSYS